jgi:hypothetical protein
MLIKEDQKKVIVLLETNALFVSVVVLHLLKENSRSVPRIRMKYLYLTIFRN